MFPHAAVGGVDRAGPVVYFIISNGGRYGFLKREGREGRYFGRKIIVGSSFAPDGGDGQDQVAQFIAFFESPAFTQKQHRFGFDGGEQVHDRSGRGRAHAKIDEGDVVGRDAGHGTIGTHDRRVVPVGKQVQVVAEVGEQYVLAKLIQGLSRVPRQPVFDDLFF